MVNSVISLVLAFGLSQASANDPQFDKGYQTLRKMAGCFLVDYSYAETKSLKEGYKIDGRVYDVNRNQSVKELVYLDKISDTKFRLQHILFATELDGTFIPESTLKHTGEDWEYNSTHVYDFKKPLTWMPLAIQPNLWTRRVTNLDDGLRYQCAAAWDLKTANPEWSCSSYAPIPGRETRDMGRKDYNTLQRTTRLISYGQSWLERQDNIKTIHEGDTKTPLAAEVGKNWYVKLPDAECQPVQEYVSKGQPFWNLLRDVWGEILDGKSAFIETAPTKEKPSRYSALNKVEREFATKDLSKSEIRAQAKSSIMTVIQDYRVKN